MAPCGCTRKLRRRRKMRKTRCRSKSGRFKRCRCGDRRYPIRNVTRRRSRCRSRRRSRYQTRCRSRSGSFKRCRYCDKRYKIRR
ncbi:splicing factor, arginine/serine-rich 19-like [Aricia agestis]|uniref:splicing factor, arginine/serine-rich 19-like n=1 Tax=Aricia agestis TaxID=91739 RepID=UPI001C205628|nr:splicing factor, arginine/serine-rich 19-like [Aricia agestis]XP_041988894.1 splicing factor, arginine/serine-rich 19-like [Aricia agestis]